MKIFRGFCLWSLIILAAIFAVANRTSIIVELWPFPFLLETQVGLVILLSLFTGIIIGLFVEKTAKIIKQTPREAFRKKNTAEENSSQKQLFSALEKTERSNKF